MNSLKRKLFYKFGVYGPVDASDMSHMFKVLIPQQYDHSSRHKELFQFENLILDSIPRPFHSFLLAFTLLGFAFITFNS